MAKFLIFDDDAGRHQIFKMALEGTDIEGSHFKTVAAARHAVASGEKFDVYFLDHDLGLSDPEHEGVDFTKALVESFLDGEFKNPPELVIIHSQNPSGARNMKADIERCKLSCNLLPFGTPEFKRALLQIVKHYSKKP